LIFSEANMARFALGVDIGGTKIAAAVVDDGGIVRGRQTVPTLAAGGAAAVLRSALDLARRVLDWAASAGLDITAIGVGAAGEVDVDRGVVTYGSGNLPGWAGLALADEFAAAMGLPAVVDNDVNALALGEGRFGAGQGFRDVLYVAVGTGVGGALVLDGRLRRGANWAAGEICHLIAAWDGDRLCSCGGRGHLEAYTSGPAMAERYAHLAGLLKPPDLRVVAARAQAGDLAARHAIAEGAEILGITLGGLLNALDPQALVIGGGVAELNELWWGPLEAALRANPLPGPAKIALRPAQLGIDAVLIGAAWLALQERAG
jgi:glucokinase